MERLLLYLESQHSLMYRPCQGNNTVGTTTREVYVKAQVLLFFFLSSDCAVKEPFPQATNDDDALRLWTLSEKLTCLDSSWSIQLHSLYPQVYIPKRRTLIQVLPPANVYTKSAHAYIHFAKFFGYLLMHVCIFIAIRPVCVHHGVRMGCLIAILMENAYMHEQIT